MNDVPPESPLLTYELTTDPDPPQASPATGKPKKLELTVVVSPPDHGAVYCDRITFQFDVGPAGTQNATYLTSVGDGIRAVQGPGGDWDLDTEVSGSGTYSFARTSEDTLVDGKGYVFTISNIEVSPVVGTAVLTVGENSATDKDTLEPRRKTFDVPKFPWKFGSVVFKTDETSVEPEQGTTLHWEGDDTGTYTLLRNGKPMKGPFKSPRPTGALTEDTVFTLRVGAPGVKVKRDYYVTVLVRNPVVNLMGPKGPVRVGEPFTLKWHTESVGDCFIKGPGLARKKIAGLPELVVRPKRAGNLEYLLSGTTASGATIQSEFTIEVLPQAPAAKAQLVLIKTSGNKDGHVAIRVADGADRFQTGPADLATGWAEADAAGGTAVIVPYAFRDRKPLPDLVLIKARGPNDLMFVHTCFAPQHGQGDDSNVMTAFQASWAAEGSWFMAPMAPLWPGDPGLDRRPDLIFVKTANTQNQKNVDVYHAYFGHAFTERRGPSHSPFLVSNAAKGTWLMGYFSTGRDKQPDLVFVQTAGTTSGKVELSYATASSNYGALGTPTPIVTGFNTKQAANGSFHLADITGDGKPDLVFVKTAKTRSKKVELYYAEAAKEYKKPVGGFTKFDLSEGSTGTWRVLGFETPFFPVSAPAPEPGPMPVGPRRDPRFADPRFAER